MTTTEARIVKTGPSQRGAAGREPHRDQGIKEVKAPGPQRDRIRVPRQRQKTAGECDGKKRGGPKVGPLGNLETGYPLAPRGEMGWVCSWFEPRS